MSNEQRCLCQAIELAHSNVENGGRPFGLFMISLP
jgi:hypothetical protein